LQGKGVQKAQIANILRRCFCPNAGTGIYYPGKVKTLRRNKFFASASFKNRYVEKLKGSIIIKTA
jgi:hypothetical protein